MREAEDRNHEVVKGSLSKSSQETPFRELRSAQWGCEKNRSHRLTSVSVCIWWGGEHKAVKCRFTSDSMASGRNETYDNIC